MSHPEFLNDFKEVYTLLHKLPSETFYSPHGQITVFYHQNNTYDRFGNHTDSQHLIGNANYTNFALEAADSLPEYFALPVSFGSDALPLVHDFQHQIRLQHSSGADYQRLYHSLLTALSEAQVPFLVHLGQLDKHVHVSPTLLKQRPERRKRLEMSNSRRYHPLD